MGNGSNTANGFRQLRQHGAVWLAAVFVALAGVASAQEVCRQDNVVLRGEWGQARFSVEIARTPQEQRIGLMHRTEMPLSAGMLFVYDRPQTLSFWMRNTLIPLDMLFINAAGVVQHIHHKAIPRDETSIFGGHDLLAVLEINGGLAARLGITKGSVLRHPSFDQDTAAWPCEN